MATDAVTKVLDFWFNDYSLVNMSDHFARWFKGGRDLDKTITDEFKTIHNDMVEGKLESWLWTQKGFVAYVIVCDQFSRHIYRGDEKAYSLDSRAREVVWQNINQFFSHLHSYEQMFILIVFQHSEHIQDHVSGIEILKTLLYFDSSNRELFQTVLFHAQSHFDIIKKFGRYPKRNKFLGRVSTDEELIYIDTHPDRPY